MTAAKKQQPQATPAVSQPQPQPTTPKPEPGASKQQQTLTKLKLAWAERKIDISKLETKVDGKFLNVIVGPGWPVIVLGQNGGIDLPQIKSFPSAFQAAVDGDKVLAKQVAREQKKTAATAPAPKPIPAKPEGKKAETPTQKKARQGAEVEKQLQA